GAGVSDRPMAADRVAAALASSRMSASVSAWSPSHNALSGSGWTSTMIPSAPTAIAARLSGRTRARRPRDRAGADLEGVAGCVLEGPDAALAQHDVEVAALRDILRRHQPFLDRRVHAPLHQYRLSRWADAP